MVAGTDCGGQPITVAVGRFGVLISLGLKRLLDDAPDLGVIAAQLDHAELEVTVAERYPDVVILDEVQVIRPALLRRLRGIQPQIGLVILVHRLSNAYGMQLLASGANACVHKDSSVPDLLTAIRLAAKGQSMLVCAETAKAPARSLDVALTRREWEVLKLMQAGYSNGQIASTLHIGIETVRTHAAHIRRKLGISGRRELVGLELSAYEQPDATASAGVSPS